MAKILQMPIATTAPQDVSGEDAATFDVLRRMREDILCCALKPDQRLRFGELRQRYGTSVGTLREALSHLVSEGLVRAPKRGGASPSPRSRWPISSISASCASISRRGRWPTPSAMAPMPGKPRSSSSYFLLSKLAAPRQDDPASVKREWGKRHKRFHDSLVATCTSPWSLHFRSELFDQARRYHWLTMIHARSRRCNEHLELRDAVLARDVALACRLIEKHIRTTVEQAASEVPGLSLGGAGRSRSKSLRRA
jgi:GntR family carbon starvation induced transcriptional regulator